MDRDFDLRKGFLLGHWTVLPDRGLLRGDDAEERVEPLVMRVLVALAEAGGDVLTKDELIETVWDGRAQSDEPLNRCISVLRRKLGDDSRNPSFVENIPRRGYRLMQPVRPLASVEAPKFAVPSEADVAESSSNRSLLGIAAVVVIAIVVAVAFSGRTASPPADGLQTLAVYPFSCAEGTDAALCFGFSEELTSTLLTADNIRVVKRTRPLTDQGESETSGDPVDGLVSGSVQRIGDRLRIAMEIIDGADGFVVLSDTVDGSVADVFRLQEQVAQSIAAAVVGETDAPVSATTRPANFEAFQAYARGQYQFERRDLSSIRQAIELFEEAIRLDPMFGPAYLRLSFAYLLLPEYDSELSVETMYDIAEARTLAGIAADPSIEDAAGTVFGFIHHKRGNWTEATRAFERAVNAETLYPLAHHWYSKLLATVGRMDASLQHAKRAHELDPDRAIIISRLAIAHFWLSNMEEAGRYFSVANSMVLEAPIHDMAYALYLLQTGSFEEAIRNTKIGLQKNGLESGWVDAVFAGFVDNGQRDNAVAIARALEEDGRLASYVVMTIWVLLGDTDRAMATAMSVEGIGQEFETGFEVLFSDVLANVRAHASFPDLLERAGLTAYWREMGCKWQDGRVSCDDEPLI